MLWLETRGEVTTHIILTTRLLAMSSAQLEEEIARQLADNPALEQAAHTCPRCGRLVRFPPCPYCLASRYALPDFGSHTAGARNREDDDDQNLEDYVAQPVTLAEHILEQIGPALRDGDAAVAEDVLDNLDRRGFYADVIEAAAARLGVPVARVAAVLRLVQCADPPGIGARDARECLLIQLEHLRERFGPERLELPVRLLREAWVPLTRGDLPGAALRLRCDRHELEQAIAFVRANLTPFPALTHWETGGPVAHGEGYTRPDAAVYLNDEGDLEVEIFSPGAAWLRVNPLYQHYASQKAAGSEQCRQWVDEAALFIKCLGQRQNAFSRLMRALVREQREYFLQGDRALRPMTRAEIAGVIGVHESTVSRAVADKIITLPGGRLVPLSHLFDGSVAAKEVLAGLIAAEPPARPFTDDHLARRMEELGYPIKRRTVAKYRTALGILPAPLRRNVPVRAAYLEGAAA